MEQRHQRCTLRRIARLSPGIYATWRESPLLKNSYTPVLSENHLINL